MSVVWIFPIIILYIIGIMVYDSYLKADGIQYEYEGEANDPRYTARLCLWPWVLVLRILWLLWKIVYWGSYVLFYHSFKVVFKGEV